MLTDGFAHGFQSMVFTFYFVLMSVAETKLVICIFHLVLNVNVSEVKRGSCTLCIRLTLSKMCRFYLFSPVSAVFLSEVKCVSHRLREIRALQLTRSRGLLGNGAYGNHCKQRALQH